MRNKTTKILQTVKFYKPSKGGIETVVENIVYGLLQRKTDIHVTVYSCNHIKSNKNKVYSSDNLKVIKNKVNYFFRSQPLSFLFPSIKNLIQDSDVIHHHFPFPNIELALVRYSSLLDKKQFIITWHANIENSRWGWMTWLYNPIIKMLLHRANHIVVTSPQLYEASRILKQFQSKIAVIPLSFSSEYASFKNKKYPQDRTFELLFVGKLRKYKGVDYLIKAIKDINVNLTIVGEGEEEQYLKKLVDELGIRPKVKFLNQVSNEELKKVYLKSDLFVLPSINEAEAFGVVQLEAMANGIPVINTKLCSGVPFVSVDNLTGLTVLPQNELVLKEAIEKIISDESMYESFSKNCLVRVREFSPEKMIQSYQKLYSQ